MATVNRTLRLGTWNLHESIPVDNDRKSADKARREIVQLLKQLNIDVIGLQEVHFSQSGSLTLESIKKYTSLKHIVHGVLSESSFFSGDQAGVAIASRFPIKRSTLKFFNNPRLPGNLNGSPIRMHDKGYISASVDWNRTSISTVSLHAFPFHLFGRDAADPAFADIWSSLSTDLDKLAAAPLIVCGDFNTDNRDLISSYKKMEMSRAISTLPTYRSESIDDMLFTSHFNLKMADTIGNFSDHRLCYAELDWSGEDATDGLST